MSTETTKADEILRSALLQLEAGLVEHIHEAMPRAPGPWTPATVFAEQVTGLLLGNECRERCAEVGRDALAQIENLQIVLANFVSLCSVMSLDEAHEALWSLLGKPLEQVVGIAYHEVREQLERELVEADDRSDTVRGLCRVQSAQVERAARAALEHAATWYGGETPRIIRSRENCESIHAAIARDASRVELACEGGRTVAWHPLAAALALLPALEPGTGDDEDRALAELLAMRLRPLLAECLGMHAGARAHRSAQAVWYGDGPATVTAEEAVQEAYETWGVDAGTAALRARPDAKALCLRYAAGFVTARVLIPNNGAGQ